MARLTFFLFLTLISNNIFSQQIWFKDFQSAQTLAIKEGKLIIIDFWASWCKPCKDMELHLWNSEEFAAISQNFVTMKVDIDNDYSSGLNYKPDAIPEVLIIDVSGEIILVKEGFTDAKGYLSMLEKLPKDARKLYDALEPGTIGQKSLESNYKIALAYQELGRENDHNLIKDAFLRESNIYLRRISGDPKLEGFSELHQILNLAYQGKTKQVSKRLQKLEGIFSDPELVELTNFIQAYCYKMDGDNENLLIIKELIENKTYLDLLDS